MADERGKAYGFGLGRDTHIAFAAAYIAILATLGAFGAVRFVSGLSWPDATRPAVPAPPPVAYREFPEPDPAHPRVLDLYPRVAILKREEGVVYLQVLVLESGEVGDVSVLKSSGSPELDAAALLAVEDWRYLPAVRKGRPVRATIVVAIRYKLT
ncbi:MAG TPA: energy transducer TonB [Rhizomicrobium sp.]|nr:energy transducer TonB [Rhizomicrobium sp.]